MEEAIELAKKYKGTAICFDNLWKPKGTAIPMNISVRLTEAIDSVIAKVHSQKDKITLQIDPDWSLTEDIDEYLKKHPS